MINWLSINSGSKVENFIHWKRSLFYELANSKFIKDGHDLLFSGPPGTGKTHLAQAIGYKAIKIRYSVQYRSIFDLIRELKHLANKTPVSINS